MTISTMEYVLPVNKHGQITLPRAFRKLFGVKNGTSTMRLMVSDGNTAVLERKKTIDEVLAELDAMREAMYRRDPSLRELAKRNAGKTARELREEFDKSPEGEAYYYKFTAAYYYEQHPEEPRTPEIQAQIDAHNRLLDELAAADPAHAERLEQYRAN